jgi:hypothetical protein
MKDIRLKPVLIITLYTHPFYKARKIAVVIESIRFVLTENNTEKILRIIKYKLI